MSTENYIVFLIETDGKKDFLDISNDIEDLINKSMQTVDYVKGFNQLQLVVTHDILGPKHDFLIKRSRKNGFFSVFMHTENLFENMPKIAIIQETARLLRAFKPMPKDINLLKLADDLEKIKAAE